jgi:hypothetical protein
MLNEVLGLTRAVWVCGLGGVAAGANLVAWLRLRRRVTPATENITPAIVPAHPRQLRYLVAGTVIACCTLIGLSLYIAVSTSASQSAQAGFVQLWLVPASDARNAQPGRAVLGLRSHLPSSTQLRLTLIYGRVPPETRTWSMELRPGQTWSLSVPRSEGIVMQAHVVALNATPKELADVSLAPTDDKGR